MANPDPNNNIPKALWLSQQNPECMKALAAAATKLVATYGGDFAYPDKAPISWASGDDYTYSDPGTPGSGGGG